MRLWLKAIYFTLGLFALYCALLAWLFYWPVSVPYLTNLAYSYVFFAYYINVFLSVLGVILFVFRAIKKQENEYFFGWLSLSLLITIIQWMFFSSLSAHR